MSQAILITAYKNFDHLMDIIEFFDESFGIYIHIDKKSVVSDTVKTKLLAYKQVKLISRKYKVNWGGINHLKCILFLAHKALKTNSYNNFHLITGHDYPIKPLSYFLEHFNQEVTTNYLDYHELPTEKWPGGGLNRVIYYNFYDILDGKKNRGKINKLVALQEKLGIKRRLSKKIPKLYGGETYWTLPRTTLQYVMDYTRKNPFLLRRFKHTFCSEEMYFHTIILNSHLGSKVVNESLRYIDWDTRNGNHPANLDMTDWEPIVRSSKLFARKFEFPVSSELKSRIDSELLPKKEFN